MIQLHAFDLGGGVNEAFHADANPGLRLVIPFAPTSARSADQAADIFQQRINRNRASLRVRPRPSLRSQALARALLGTRQELPRQLVRYHRTRALVDRVAGTDNPRGPRIVALEDGSGGKRHEGVDERELVSDVTDPEKACAHVRERLVCVATLNGENGADEPTELQEPRPRIAKRRGRLSEQAIGLVGITSCQGNQRQSGQQMPYAACHTRSPESLETRSEMAFSCIDIADRVL